jgi:hypothetical protein
MLLHEPPPILCDPLQVRGAQRLDRVLPDTLGRVIPHNKSSLPVYYSIRYPPDGVTSTEVPQAMAAMA